MARDAKIAPNLRGGARAELPSEKREEWSSHASMVARKIKNVNFVTAGLDNFVSVVSTAIRRKL